MLEQGIRSLASSIEVGDKIYSKTIAGLDSNWLKVKKTQLNQDGSVRIGTEFSEIRMAQGTPVMVIKGNIDKEIKRPFKKGPWKN